MITTIERDHVAGNCALSNQEANRVTGLPTTKLAAAAEGAHNERETPQQLAPLQSLNGKYLSDINGL